MWKLPTPESVGRLKQETPIILEKWLATGLLDNVPEQQRTTVAILLENQEKLKSENSSVWKTA